jgi:hypothetical protein
LFWRKLGQGGFAKTPLIPVARGVYTVKLPTMTATDDLEYYVQVLPRGEAPVYFPATAPYMNQTLVLQPQ